MTRLLFTCSVAVVLGCSSAPRQEAPMPTTARQWLAVLDSASGAAEAGNYRVADSLLARFGLMHPQAPEARESEYWRALLKLDSGNTSATPEDAVAHLDVYLADSTRGPGRREALLLRRLVLALDSAGQALDSARAEVMRIQADTTSRPAAREEELQREIDKLKEQLEQANAELERIKRRLAAPRP